MPFHIVPLSHFLGIINSQSLLLLLLLPLSLLGIEGKMGGVDGCMEDESANNRKKSSFLSSHQMTQ